MSLSSVFKNLFYFERIVPKKGLWLYSRKRNLPKTRVVVPTLKKVKCDQKYIGGGTQIT